jgi:hypothetical protein
MPPLDEARLPDALIERFTVMPEACFQHDAPDRMIALLRFLAPLTGGARMRAF